MQSIVLSSPTSSASNELLETAFRLRGRIFRWGAAILVVAVIAAAMVSPPYTPETTLLVLPGAEYTFRGIAGTGQAINQPIERQQILATEVAILGSTELHREVMREVGLADIYPDYLKPPGMIARAIASIKDAPNVLRDAMGLPVKQAAAKPDPIELALKEFESHLSAFAAVESNTILLKFSHKDPVVATKVLSEVQKLYLEQRASLYADLQATAVQEEAQNLRIKLDEADRNLSAFKAANDITSFPTRQEILQREQGDAEKDRAEARSLVDQQTAKIAQLKTTLASLPAKSVQQDTDIDQRMSALRSNLDQVRTKQADALSRYQPGSPQAKALQAQLASREADLAKARGDRSVSGTHVGPNLVYTSTQLDLVRAQSDLQGAQARLASDTVQINALIDQQRSFNRLEQKLEELARAQKVAGANYDDAAKLLSQRKVIEQVQATAQANVRVLSPVVQPPNPAPLRRTLMAVGILLSLLTGALVVLLGNFFRRGYLTPATLERECGIPILVSVPDLEPSGGGLRLGVVRPA